MKKQFFIILFISSFALSDEITFKDGISADVKILDTAGTAVKIKRDSAVVPIDKSKVSFIVMGLDTISYEGYIAPQSPAPAAGAAVSPSPVNPVSAIKRQHSFDTGNYNGTIRLTKTTTTGYSAPMMGANGMMMGGGGPYTKSVDAFEVEGSIIKVDYLGGNLLPYLDKKSGAANYVNYYQGQKIGAIGCYAGSFIFLMVALFAGQDDAGSSYGYDPQTGWGTQKNTKINSTFAPSIAGSCICLLIGLILQFTAREQLVKAVKAHNKSVLNDGAKSE